MGLWDAIMDLFEGNKWEKATAQMREKVGFDIFDRNLERSYDAKWYDDQPYIFILYLYKNDHMVRREFYEFYKSAWHYVGYMDKKACIDFFWRFRGEESYRQHGYNNRRDHDNKQTNHIMDDLELKEYFQYYRKYANPNMPPNDGAKPLRRRVDNSPCDPELEKKIDAILRDPKFFKELKS